MKYINSTILNNLNNKTLLIAGIILIGLVTTYTGNNELGAVALGGLVGYLTQDSERDNDGA